MNFDLSKYGTGNPEEYKKYYPKNVDTTFTDTIFKDFHLLIKSGKIELASELASVMCEPTLTEYIESLPIVSKKLIPKRRSRKYSYHENFVIKMSNDYKKSIKK
jgi:hypothetical protein